LAVGAIRKATGREGKAILKGRVNSALDETLLYIMYIITLP
jgi:hypothetical protein